ncbi:hypothetical protein B0H17DRAFT_1075325 [Mycena rosella]|uniref:Uncharacterized protein n=1 Tax=Mycena rosella TaxID=1033263 RepID=A0AAD7D6Y6_MYCRO|nr:hypothetical protein B0H17DRAFT_1075325 [Mycena rosella]
MGVAPDMRPRRVDEGCELLGGSGSGPRPRRNQGCERVPSSPADNERVARRRAAKFECTRISSSAALPRSPQKNLSSIARRPLDSRQLESPPPGDPEAASGPAR